MQKLTHIINLKLHDNTAPPKITVQQGDTERILEIHLWDGLNPYKISPGCTAVLSAKKPDKTTLYNHCDIRNNVIYYDFTPDTTSCPGTISTEIRIIGSESCILTSAAFFIEVFSTAFTSQDAAKS